MKIQKMYVKSTEAYQTDMLIELETWISPEALLKEIHNDNPDLQIGKCHIRTSIHIDEKDNPILKVILFLPCSSVVEFM